MPQIFKKRLTIIALALVVVAVFALVDTPATVRTKSLIINMLPLDAQSKIDAVTNLCQAAYAGVSFGSSVCYSVNYSKAASEEADETRRQERCDEFIERITFGDLKADWKVGQGTTMFPSVRRDEIRLFETAMDAIKRLKKDEIHIYFYVGSDPEMKDWLLYPDCVIRTPGGA